MMDAGRLPSTVRSQPKDPQKKGDVGVDAAQEFRVFHKPEYRTLHQLIGKNRSFAVVAAEK
jgi:hypothetical protein